MYPLSFDALDNLSKFQPIQQIIDARNNKVHVHGDLQNNLRASSFHQNGKPMYVLLVNSKAQIIPMQSWLNSQALLKIFPSRVFFLDPSEFW